MMMMRLRLVDDDERDEADGIPTIVTRVGCDVRLDTPRKRTL